MPRPRRAVHAASGTRLGDANPRQEGPADLRLVPPALAAWATAALTLDAAPEWVTGIAVLCLVAAGVLLLTRGRAGPRVPVAAALLCVAAAAVSAGLHGADLRRGPVPGLARNYATATAEIEVTSDPRLTRPRVQGDRPAPTSVLIKGEVRRVEKAGGEVVDTRTPVLVMVDVTGTGGSADRGAGALGSPSAAAGGGEGGVGSSGGVVNGGGAGLGAADGGGFGDGSAKGVLSPTGRRVVAAPWSAGPVPRPGCGCCLPHGSVSPRGWRR